MALLFVIVAAVFTEGIATANNCSNIVPDNHVIDYYWREYLGVIPSDAIPGGFDRAHKHTYIGQMYRTGFGLLPSTIYRGSNYLLASGGGSSFTSDSFVKILCSRNHHKYKWIPTENSQSHLLTAYHLVIGGNEGKYVLNIGRVNHEMEIIMGKVFAHNTPHRGLSIPYKNKEATYQSYEILVYDYAECSNSTKSDPPIDIRFSEPNVV